MDEDLFLEKREADLTVGLYRFQINGKENLVLPLVSIQLKGDRDSIGGQLAKNSRMFIKVEPLGGERYTYIIHGDFMKSGTVFNSVDEEVASAIFFDFLVTFQMDEKMHNLFQKHMEETGFWTMRVTTSVPTYVLVYARSDIILDILDSIPSAAQRAAYH